MTTLGATLLSVVKPYPGLRPFETNEGFLFHGRQEHTRALLDRLASERFLAVVGTSGSGKSSLVRAGLLPALYRGYLVGATSRWRIAIMRPGNAPMAELARALAASGAGGDKESQILTTLQRSSLGLTMAVRAAQLGAGENFLLVVDQFEELFRFERERRSQDGGAEAMLFVQSLLEGSESRDVRVYVVLTIRSDFLGQCAQFTGLPEALNRGQYLIPHLTRAQRQEAIELPPQLTGARIAPALVQQLLNDLGDDPAQLPVLQHALMRTFSALAPGESEVGFQHYEAAGGIASALDRHGNSIFDGLAPGPQAWVERIFRCLTTVEGGRPVRRPARLDRLHAVLGVDNDAAARADADAAIRAFADPANSLVMSSTGLELTDETVVDISHETLIRNWEKLRQWVRAETRSVEWLRSIATDCMRFRARDASEWRDPELQRVLDLKERDRWNSAWASQYLSEHDPPFSEVLEFLDRSVVHQREERERDEAARQRELEDARKLAAALGRAKKLYAFLIVALLALLTGGVLAAIYAARVRDRETTQAQEQLRLLRDLDDRAKATEKLNQELRTKSDELDRIGQSGAEAERLRSQIGALQQRIDDSKTAEQNSRNAQQRAVGGLNSDYAAAVKQIAALQRDLEQARGERDQLQDRIETMATVQVRDASYWKTKAEQAEDELKRLRAASANTGPPTVITLPLDEPVRIESGPLANRVSLMAHDYSPTLIKLMLAVATQRDSSLPEAKSKEIPCPSGPSRMGQLGAVLWCLPVYRTLELKLPKPSGAEIGSNSLRLQAIGQFRIGTETYSVVANGIVPSLRGQPVTVVIYPAPAAAAAR